MATPNQIIIDSPNNNVDIQTNNNQLHIISEVGNTEVNVTQPVTTTIQVAAPGPQGPKGDKGDPGVSINNQIATGSITASVNVGADTFKVQSGSSTFFTINSSLQAGLGPGITVPEGEFGLSIYNTTSTPHTIIVGTDNQTFTVPNTASVVIGGTNAHLDLYNPINVIAADALIGAIRFRNNDTQISITKAQIAAYATDTSPDGYLVFSTQQNPNALAERMRITNTGLVGIGTTTPTNTLEVNGGITAISITASIISASSGITGSLNTLTGNITISNGSKLLGDSNQVITYNSDSNFPSSVSSSFGLVNIGNVGSYITAREDNLFGSSTILQFFTQGSERARITAGGRLGVNTITPTARLEVKGDSSLSTGVTFQALNSSNTSLLYIRDDGNTGIGTTTPTNKLQVVGGITATSLTASIISASSGITGSLFGTASWAQNVIGGGISSQITTGSITASVNIGTDTFKVQSGSSTFLYISSSGNTTINNSLYIIQKASIGTTHQSASLTISASSAEDAILVKINDTNVTDKFKINNEGIMVLGKLDNPPFAVEGGIFFSSSNDYFLGFS